MNYSNIFKRIVCLAFIFIISVPVLIGTLFDLFKISLDVELSNDNSVASVPRFSANTFYNGSFQKEFEEYINSTLAGRGPIIRTYNQLNVALFDQLKDQEIKNGYFYEKIYLKDYSGLIYDPSDIEVRTKIYNYMKSLDELSRKLDNAGKKLIVYSSVSKFEYTFEDIPEKYKFIRAKNNFNYSARDFFEDSIKDFKFTYISGKDELKKAEYPIFYRGGIHWSRTAEQIVDQRVLKEINVFCGNMKPFEFEGVASSNKGFFRDEDMYNVANLWCVPDDLYYEYKIRQAEDKEYTKPVIMIQGSSFSEGLFKDIADNNLTDECFYIHNNNFIKDINDNYIIDERYNEKGTDAAHWDKFSLYEYIDRTDVVCIEFNPTYMFMENYGFVDYLNKILD